MNLTEDQDPWQQFLLRFLLPCYPCCVNQLMFVPAPVEVILPPRSGGEAFDGSGSSGVHRPQDVSQSHWGLAVFFSLKLMLLQMRWNIFFRLERNNSRIKSTNQYSYEQSEVLEFLVIARVLISARCAEMRGLTRLWLCKLHGAGRIGKADSKSSGQVIIHHQGRANQACNQACCHVGILLSLSHLVLRKWFRRLRFSVWPACMRRNC